MLKPDRVIAVRNTKIVYRDGNRCIKIFKKGHAKTDIIAEALNQAMMENTPGLLVPKILEVTTVDEKWAIISEYIRGKPLSRLMEEYPERKNEYLDLFIDLQLLIHSQTAHTLNELHEQTHREIDETSLGEEAKELLHKHLDTLPVKNSLCHGDFEPSNIIIASGSDPYVTDWSHVRRGDPDEDAARSYLLFWLDGNIGTAEKYLEKYCSKTGNNKNNILRWIPLVAASKYVKGNEQQREFLLSWINKVKNYESKGETP